ncbi:MAG: copper chaperone PCu(A)C [Nitriliruptoraceae bacterium]|nr:copper chaperone PCu(A)C [Nitriliruptoraceae bacterium]
MRSTSRRRPLVALLAVGLVLAACGGDDVDLDAGTPDVQLVGPAQATAPVAGASILVFELANTGDGDDQLTAATTDVALGIEIHETRLDDGRASMVELEEVALPAGSTIRSRSGGLHLMMIVPDDSVVVGTTFEMTLEFARSAPMTVDVLVGDLSDVAESTFDDPEEES